MAAVEQINRASQLQASATQQTSAALDQIEKSAKARAEERARSPTSACRAIEAALEDGPRVRRKPRRRRARRRSTRHAGERRDRSSGSEAVGRKIEKIVDAIALIAVQTSMLAVSGSVEAARAGDAGRGFAVVSNDIRGLAREASDNVERAKDTVRGILDQIASLQERPRADRRVVGDRGAEQPHGLGVAARRSSDDVAALGAANEAIARGRRRDPGRPTVETATGARQIAAAAEEASAAPAQAATAATEQARGAEDLAAAIEEIASLADELKQQMPERPGAVDAATRVAS